MVLELLRPIILLLMMSFFAYLMYRIIKRIIITNGQEEVIDEAKIKIQTDLQDAKKLPDVDGKKLEKSRGEIKDFIKQGGK